MGINYAQLRIFSPRSAGDTFTRKASKSMARWKGRSRLKARQADCQSAAD
jgi:hypothetical protein